MDIKIFSNLNIIKKILLIILLVTLLSFLAYLFYSNSKIAEASKAYLLYISDSSLDKCPREIVANKDAIEMGLDLMKEQACYEEEINKYLTGLTDFQNSLKYISCALTKNSNACSRLKDSINRIIYEMNLSMTMYEIYYEMELNYIDCVYDFDGSFNQKAWISGNCAQYNHNPSNDFMRPLNYLRSEDYIGEVKRTSSVFAN